MKIQADFNNKPNDAMEKKNILWRKLGLRPTKN